MNLNMKNLKEQVGDVLRGVGKPEDSIEQDESTQDDLTQQEELSDEKEGAQGGEEESDQEEEVSTETDGEGGEEAGEEEEGDTGEEEDGDEDTEDKGESEQEEKDPRELEMEALRKQNEMLQAQLNEVSGKQQEVDIEEEEVPVLDVGDTFVDKEADLEDLFQDADKINATLGKVASKAANVSLEHVYKRLPAVIIKIVQDEVSAYRQSDQFFIDNKDLIPQREFVRYVYNDMVNKDPETSPLDHFKVLAKEVRRRLGTGEQKGSYKTAEVEHREKKKKRRSTFNKPGGKRITTPNAPKGIGGEIHDMMGV